MDHENYGSCHVTPDAGKESKGTGVEFGFPKSVVTRVRRRLTEEKPYQKAKASKSGATAKSRLQLALASALGAVPWQMPDITSSAQAAVKEGLSHLP